MHTTRVNKVSQIIHVHCYEINTLIRQLCVVDKDAHKRDGINLSVSFTYKLIWEFVFRKIVESTFHFPSVL